jgi:hypothetical protein
MTTTSRADYLKHWEELLSALENNAPWSVTRLEENRLELAYHFERVKARSTEQAVHKSRMQQATRDVEAHVKAGKEVATALHDMLRGLYGRQAEKLVEYRMQPFRPQTTQRAPESPGELTQMAETTKTPPEPDGDPARAAAPETDGST